MFQILTLFKKLCFASFWLFGLNDVLSCLSCREWMAGALTKVTRVASESIITTEKTLKSHYIYLYKDEINYFSSKQSFEEKSLISI